MVGESPPAVAAPDASETAVHGSATALFKIRHSSTSLTSQGLMHEDRRPFEAILDTTQWFSGQAGLQSETHLKMSN